MAKEYIEKKFSKEHLQLESDCGYIKSLEDVFNVIDAIPAADVVEVVRCGECEKRSKSADLTFTVYCPWIGQRMDKNDFCSYGERRNDD